MQKPTKTALYLSAFMAPGAGQFFQRRWTAGAIFLGLFLVCLVCLLMEIIRPMAYNILAAIDYAEHQSNLDLVEFRVLAILAWLGLSLAVYLAGLLDTWRGYARQCREWSGQYVRLPAVPMPQADGKS